MRKLLARLWPARLQRGDTLSHPESGHDGGSAQTQVRASHAADVFTPTRPKAARDGLIGRGVEYNRILSAILEEKAHVVLHSERGRGKTSLINLVIESLRRRNIAVAQYSCGAGTTFDSIMRGLMSDLPKSMRVGSMVGFEGPGCSSALPSGKIEPSDIVRLPLRLECPFLVCIVDEFDRVRDFETLTLIADSIKQLSDRSARLLFVIIGTSESVSRLLDEHLSIQRSMSVVSLPLLEDHWIESLIKLGTTEISLDFSQTVVDRLVAISRGMPYMPQLICLRLSQVAAARQVTKVDESDLNAVAKRLLQEAEPRVSSLYASLTRHGLDTEMTEAMEIVASAEQDRFGCMRFSTVDGSVQLGGSHSLPEPCWNRILDAGVLSVSARTPSGFATMSNRALLNHALLRKLVSQDIEGPIHSLDNTGD